MTFAAALFCTLIHENASSIAKAVCTMFGGGGCCDVFCWQREELFWGKPRSLIIIIVLLLHLFASEWNTEQSRLKCKKESMRQGETETRGKWRPRPQTKQTKPKSPFISTKLAFVDHHKYYHLGLRILSNPHHSSFYWLVAQQLTTKLIIIITIINTYFAYYTLLLFKLSTFSIIFFSVYLSFSIPYHYILSSIH